MGGDISPKFEIPLKNVFRTLSNIYGEAFLQK